MSQCFLVYFLELTELMIHLHDIAIVVLMLSLTKKGFAVLKLFIAGAIAKIKGE